MGVLFLFKPINLTKKIMDKDEKTNLGYYASHDAPGQVEMCPLCNEERKHINDCFCDSCDHKLIYEGEHYMASIDGNDIYVEYVDEALNHKTIGLLNYKEFGKYPFGQNPNESELKELLDIFNKIKNLYKD